MRSTVCGTRGGHTLSSDGTGRARRLMQVAVRMIVPRVVSTVAASTYVLRHSLSQLRLQTETLRRSSHAKESTSPIRHIRAWSPTTPPTAPGGLAPSGFQTRTRLETDGCESCGDQTAKTATGSTRRGRRTRRRGAAKLVSMQRPSQSGERLGRALPW